MSSTFPTCHSIYALLTFSSPTDEVPASVRDQIADHDSNAVKYYLNNVVQEVMNVDRSSRARVQGLACSLGLDTNSAAPTRPTDEQIQRIAAHPKMQTLSKKEPGVVCQDPSSRLHINPRAAGTALYREKMRVQSKLNSAKIHLWNHYGEKNRTRHFRHADTERFNCRIQGHQEPLNLPPTPLQYCRAHSRDRLWNSLAGPNLA
ncbi:hypothetical protein RJZ56_006952 [Blastomyces dermatitidis]